MVPLEGPSRAFLMLGFNESQKTKYKSLDTSDSSGAGSQTYLTFGNGLCHNGNTLGLSLNHRLLLYKTDSAPGNPSGSSTFVNLKAK